MAQEVVWVRRGSHRDGCRQVVTLPLCPWVPILDMCLGFRAQAFQVDLAVVQRGHRHFSKQLLLQTQPRECLPPNMEVQLLVLEGRNMPVTRHEPRLRCRRIRGGWMRQCKTRRVSQFIISREPAVTDQQCPTPGKDLR